MLCVTCSDGLRAECDAVCARLFEFHATHDKDCVNDFATANLGTECPRIWWHTTFPLWETTVVRKAIETARISASSGGHSSSDRCQQGTFMRET